MDWQLLHPIVLEDSLFITLSPLRYAYFNSSHFVFGYALLSLDFTLPQMQASLNREAAR